MSDEKKYSEREVVLRERRAFVCGVDTLYIQPEIAAGPITGSAATRAEKLAAKHYPLPKVTRPREVIDPEVTPAAWRVRYGQLEVRPSGQSRWFEPDGSWAITPDRVKLWADLIANPTEEVDDA